MAVLYYLGHAIQIARSEANRSSCSNNLKQIGIGLHNYHDTWGKYPPAFTCDKDGKPAHSWRTLIFPFLVSSPLYSQYRFDEPWDGPNNRLLHGSHFGDVYSCPGEYAKHAGPTSYLAVLGPNTAWPDDGRSADLQTLKGKSPVLVVVEVRNSGIHWMEPRDLHIDDITNGVNEVKGKSVSGVHPTGAMGLFADGHVELLPNDLSPEQLRKLLTEGSEPGTVLTD